MVDIDHFKQVNDTYGHAAGDDVLAELARRMERACHNYDIIGRYGGEEFIAILPDTDEPEAVHIAERLRLAVCSNTFSVTGAEIPVTISVGVASARPTGPELLLKAADDALYLAKRQGRNQAALASSPRVVGSDVR